MFSRRTPESMRLNRLTRAVEARRSARLKMADLTVSNPTKCGIPYPESELLGALAGGGSLAYEPTARGLAAAREAVAAWHGGLDPERLILASSTSEAYSWIFKMACNAGEAVLVPKPSYPLFDCLAQLDSVTVEHYSLVEEEGWRIDFDSMEAATEAVRIVAAVNPNNPTGSYIHPDDYARLLTLAARRGWMVVLDEVFFDYEWRGVERVTGFSHQDEALVITLAGLSKSLGLPQMKLGWMHVDGPERLSREALERLEWIADAYLSVSAPVALAAPRWLELGRQIQAPIRSRCQAALGALRAASKAGGSARVFEPEGGWTAVVELPRVRSDEEWAVEMAEAGYLVQPGYYYDFEREGRVVVSLLAAPEDLAAGFAEFSKLGS